MRRQLDSFTKFFHLQSWLKLLLLCVLVGVVAGLGALALDKGLELLSAELLANWLFKIESGFSGSWPLIVVPAVGAGLAAAIALWLAPEATGHGTDSVIRAFHRRKGEIRARVPLVKGLCSVLTIGTGGSAGKEGPIAQIGAGFGSTLATLLKLSVRDRRILMLAGVAGGIGAIFKAPLAGALFAAEVLYREPDFEHDAVIPGVISSVTAYAIFTAVEGHERILQFKDSAGIEIPALRFPSAGGSMAAELCHYATLSVLCTVVAYLFVKSLQKAEHLFERIPIPKFAKAAAGGALLGAMAIVLMMTVGTLDKPANQILGTSHPEHIMAGGYEYLQAVVNSALDTTVTDYRVSLKLAGFLLVVVAAKILATSLTIGSGGSGGVLFPALFLGGATGAAYAKFLRALTDAGWLNAHFGLPPNARAGMILVGMGGVFTACTKTPIASLVMVSEITGSYSLSVPLMMTCASSYILSRSFTVNNEQVAGMADSPAHRGDFLINVLEVITVREAILEQRPPELIRADTPFKKVLARIKNSTSSVFPIVDEKNCLVGIFSLSDIRQIMNEQLIANLIVAGDLGTTDVSSVTMETNLDEALRLLTQKNLDELPIVQSDKENKSAQSSVSSITLRPRGQAGTQQVIGMLSRRDLISAYNRHLHAIQVADDQENKGSQVFLDALDTADSLPPLAHRDDLSELRQMAAQPQSAPGADAELLAEPPDESVKS